MPEYCFFLLHLKSIQTEIIVMTLLYDYQSLQMNNELLVSVWQPLHMLLS